MPDYTLTVKALSSKATEFESRQWEFAMMLADDEEQRVSSMMSQTRYYLIDDVIHIYHRMPIFARGT